MGCSSSLPDRGSGRLVGPNGENGGAADAKNLRVKVPVIGQVMGDRGLISRIVCAKFGGYLAAATLSSGIDTVPGEPSINDVLHVYNFRLIRPDTKLFGVIGKPISQSKSPLLYNEGFKSVGFNGVYLHLLVDDITNLLAVFIFQ